MSEDEHNTLRAWAFDDYAPLVPLYVDNLLPQTESIQEKTTTATVCVEELKQIVLAYNCLYRGVGNLLINLLQPSKRYLDYDEPWRAQYGDGMVNEIYEIDMNPIFVGFNFCDISAYFYHEFQVCLFGMLVFVKSRDAHHVVLNPGKNYELGRYDRFLVISPSVADVKDIQELTETQFKRSIGDSLLVPTQGYPLSTKKGDMMEKQSEDISGLPKNGGSSSSPTSDQQDLNSHYTLGYPIQSYADEKSKISIFEVI